MNEYEVLVETINPCGGEAHAKREILEVSAHSPESYVQSQGRFPILDITVLANGDTVIFTGDGKGNAIRYTFTE